VISARRVRLLGQRFFDFINFGAVADVRNAFEGIKRFNAGGIVIPPPTLPKFSMGGIVDAFASIATPLANGGAPALAGEGGGISGRPLMLDLGGGNVAQVVAPPDAVRQLLQAGRVRSVASTFRRGSPNWNR
jgi:hypothetical protein